MSVSGVTTICLMQCDTSLSHRVDCVLWNVMNMNICGIMLCNKTAHFRVTFYCDQSKAHLCTNHTVKWASWCATPARWMDYLGKGEVLTNTDLNRFVNKIWEKHTYCVRGKSLRFLISTCEKWERKQKSWVYIFVQCRSSVKHSEPSLPLRCIYRGVTLLSHLGKA